MEGSGSEFLRQQEGLPLTEPTPFTPGLERFEKELRGAIEGEVRFDDGYRAIYAADGSNYRMPPIGVVVPRSVEEVVRTVAASRRHDLPVLLRGGGTSLSGETCNEAIVIDVSKHLRRIIALDPNERWARVEPGVVLDHLRTEAEKHHLTFGPDPSTHAYCTLGGMIGNNSCGVHSVMAGRTVDNIEAMEILTYDGLRVRVGPTPPEALAEIIAGGGRRGEIYRRLAELRDRYGDLIRARFPKIPRLVSGFGLDQLLPENGFNVARSLVGTEGTCVVVLEATCRLVPSPPDRCLAVLAYEDIFHAADEIPRLLEFEPIGLEGFDDRLASDMRQLHIHEEALQYFPEGGGWLLVEFGGWREGEAREKAQGMLRELQNGKWPAARLYDDPVTMRKVWEARESGLGATARVPGRHDAWEGWEDSAVPPAKLGVYLRELQALFRKHGYTGALYGHFGQGCVHTRIDFAFETAEGVARYHRFMEDATDLCVSLGGSLSGEHGDGQARAEFLPKMFGPELVQAFREFKAIWDPGERMNPGKIVRLSGEAPFLSTENLRFGPGIEVSHPRTHFRFPEDRGDFARATARCVGVGLCRRTTSEEGVMCPSYMVTHEEEHTTRGRAHALFEMLHGGIIEDGWRSEGVKRSLDLCLSCKGCKSDCPMKVDMATYKAEFLSHCYQGRLRPRAAYAMGLVAWWARLASLAPGVVNALTGAPGLSAFFKWAAGVSQKREIPRFAPKTFRQWFREREAPRIDGPALILWPDTFSNHFHPEIAIAALEVLEAAGFRVIVPEAPLCCGRPLYDYGMLATARRLLEEIMDELGPLIDRGVPIVGLEPSCVAVFRDELKGLFPLHERAVRLQRQTFVFSEFMQRFAKDFAFEALGEKALVQTHCHQHAVIGFQDDRALLRRLGVEAEVLPSGCCGMAGSFGFEADKYEVSIAAGERVLLPAVRNSNHAMVLADGFSCRTQIEQGSARKPLHIAEAARLSLERAGRLPPPPPLLRAEERRRRKARGLWMAAGVLGLALWVTRRRG